MTKFVDSMEIEKEETTSEGQEENVSEPAAQDREGVVNAGAASPSSPPKFGRDSQAVWETELIVASRNGNVQVLKSFLHEFRAENGLDYETQLLHARTLFRNVDIYGYTLLHTAVEHGHFDFVKEVIQFTHFYPIGDDPKQTLMYFMISYELLIDVQKFPHMESYIMPPLFVSNRSLFDYFKDVEGIEVEEFPIFVENVSAHIYSGPLSNLGVNGHHWRMATIMKYITPEPISGRHKPTSFEKMSDILLHFMKVLMINIPTKVYRRTSLHVAILKEHQCVAKYVLDEQDKRDNYVSSIQQRVLRDEYDLTPLHYAVLTRSTSLVKVLVESSSYSEVVNAGDLSLRTPLHLACGMRDSPGQTSARDLTENLLKSSSIDLNAKDCCGFTPLHWAVHVGALEVVKLLLGEKFWRIKLYEKDCDGKNVLHHVHAVVRESAAGFHRDRRDIMLELENVFTSDPRVEKSIDRMYRDRQVYVDAANEILVGAALIASVTYGGWLQPPLGDHDEHTRMIVRVFWVLNSLSFSFAIATVMAGAGAVLPMADLYIEDAVDRVRDWLEVTAFLLLVSAAFVLGAFGAAGFASTTMVGGLEANMTATTIVGGAVCLPIALVFVRGLLRVSNVSPGRRLLIAYVRGIWTPSAAWRVLSTSLAVRHPALAEQLTLSRWRVDPNRKYVLRRAEDLLIFLTEILFVIILGFPLREILTSDDFNHGLHAYVEFPETRSCRNLCIERDSLFPFRSGKPTLEQIMRHDKNLVYGQSNELTERRLYFN